MEPELEDKLNRIIELLEKVVENQTLMNGGEEPKGCIHEWIEYIDTTAPHRYCKKCSFTQNVFPKY